MIFNSKHIQASLTGVTTPNGQSHPIPSDGKILVCSGETIHGFAQVEDPNKLESMTIEFAAYQNVAVEAIESSLPSAGEMSINALGGVQAQIGLVKATNKPVVWRSATELFRQVRVVEKDELELDGGKVRWEFKMPEVDGKGGGLPPSVQLPQSRSAGGSTGYNRYQVTVTIERKASPGRTKSESIILPLFYLPYNASYSPPSIAPLSTFLSSTNPDTIPPVPEKWKVEVAKDTWDLQPKKSLFGSSSSSSSSNAAGGGGGQIRAQLAYPHLDTWPSGEFVPYHLLIIYTSPSPPTINLTSCETTLTLTQRISCNVRRKKIAVRAEEKVLSGQKVGGVGFKCTEEGVWTGDEKDEVGWSKVLVVMGQIRVKGLPTFFTDVMSLVYAINLTITLPSDSPFSNKKQTILLAQPALGSPLYPSPTFHQFTNRSAQTSMASEMIGKYYHADEQDFQWVRGEGGSSRGPFEEPWKKLGSDMTR